MDHQLSAGLQQDQLPTPPAGANHDVLARCSRPPAIVNRAAVLHGPGDLRIEERPVRAPGEHEVVLEILAVGVCGSDVHYYEHGQIDSRVMQAPLVLGHEACGRIIAAGPSVSRCRMGDRVCVEPGVPCGRCRECRADSALNHGRRDAGGLKAVIIPRLTRSDGSRRQMSCGMAPCEGQSGA